MVRVFFYCGSGPKIMQGIYLVEEDPHAGWAVVAWLVQRCSKSLWYFVLVLALNDL
jgi:hypothetical protein